MRILWLISAGMVVAGALLSLVALTGAASPLILIGGVLLLWSGVVKVIVLRIWRSTLATPALAADIRSHVASSLAGDQP